MILDHSSVYSRVFLDVAKHTMLLLGALVGEGEEVSNHS